MNKDKLLTVNEACKDGRMSRTFLWQQRKEGKIKSIQLGRKVLVRKSDLDAYFDRNSSQEKSNN